MLNNEEIKILKELTGSINSRAFNRSLTVNHPELLEKLKQITTDNRFKNLSETIYRIVNDIEGLQTCSIDGCEKPVKFKGFEKGYAEWCTSHGKHHGMKQSLMEKYGVDNAAHIPGIQEKKRQTCLEKYGVESHNQLDEVKKKKKETLFDHYGQDGLAHKDIRKKRRKTALEKYGVEHHTKLESVQETKRQTCMDKYGVDHIMKVPKIVDKIKNNWEETRLHQTLKWMEFFNDNDVKLIQYINTMGQVYLQCRNCLYEFTICTTSLKRNKMAVCPNCFPKYMGFSKAEKEVYDYVKSILPTEIVIENDKSQITPYELDIYIPSKNVAIEYCGLWCHSSDENSPHIKHKKYHLYKHDLCKDKNIQLITLFEDEWIHKQDIIKSIISQKLGVCDNTIYARKCVIRHIEFSVKKEFLINNHLQGDNISSENYGLYYNNELVSVMTFVYRPQYNTWELLRFCNKCHYRVIGGASKLLKQFINNHPNEPLLTYADKRYSNGNLYFKLGFTHTHDSLPNYWYWGKDIVGKKHKMNYYKGSLKDNPHYDESLSEQQIMALNGYHWIYDCGNMVFKLN